MTSDMIGSVGNAARDSKRPGANFHGALAIDHFVARGYHYGKGGLPQTSLV